MEALRETIPQALESVGREVIWKFYSKSLRIMKAYQDGLVYGTEEFQNTVYKSHRRTRDNEL